MIGRFYRERGKLVKVLARWGPGGGPRNVLIERFDGSKVVRPFRGLRVVKCVACLDTGHVCENHPDMPWPGIAPVEECCGGAGMPCLVCCDPIPMDGTHSILEAFTPRK